MAGEFTIRPMRADDVAAAWDVGWAAIQTVIPASFITGDPVQDERGRLRVAHLLATDPGGCWVAQDTAGTVVGVALALIRERLWGFSLFGVDPQLHGRRIGSEMFERALAYGDGTDSQIILSTVHPAAMRRYFRSGFRLLPAVAAAGALNASRIPDGLRSRRGDAEADASVIDAASRRARGASHMRDIPKLLEGGGELLVIEDRGFAIHGDGSPQLLAAADDDAARDLLWSCFAAAKPGTTVHVDFLTAGNDWAVDVSIAAGLTLDAAEGPTFVRGAIGPVAPYLPSGAYL